MCSRVGEGRGLFCEGAAEGQVQLYDAVCKGTAKTGEACPVSSRQHSSRRSRARRCSRDSLKVKCAGEVPDTEGTRGVKGDLASAARASWRIPAEEWVKKGPAFRGKKMPPLRLEGGGRDLESVGPCRFLKSLESRGSGFSKCGTACAEGQTV